jgi:hypothetical protein
MRSMRGKSCGKQPSFMWKVASGSGGSATTGLVTIGLSTCRAVKFVWDAFGGVADEARRRLTTATATMIVIKVAGWPIMLRLSDAASPDVVCAVSAARRRTDGCGCDANHFNIVDCLQDLVDLGPVANAQQNLLVRPHIARGGVALARPDWMQNVDAQEVGTVTVRGRA